MSTIIVAPTPSGDISMADLRAMAAPETAPSTEAKPTTETATEPDKPAAATEAESEPAEPKTVPDEKEEPLPENVSKRIAKEVERQNALQRKIDEAINGRKAKEAELEKVTAGKPGSEPAPTTAPAAASTKPVKPQFGKDGQTWDQYQAELTAYEAAHESWLISETERRTEAKFVAKKQQEAAQVQWDKAIETHGKDFPALMDTVIAATPQGLQLAISGLDNWSGVAAHLAKDPAKLKELAGQFATNPYKAIATLGRIEAGLKTPATKTAASTPLPDPPEKAGGGASVTTGAVDLEKASFSQFKKAVTKMRG